MSLPFAVLAAGQVAQSLPVLPWPFDFDGQIANIRILSCEASLSDAPKKLTVFKVKSQDSSKSDPHGYASRFFKESPSLRVTTNTVGSRDLIVWQDESKYLGVYRDGRGFEYVKPFWRRDAKELPVRLYPTDEECSSIAASFLNAKGLLSPEIAFSGIADNTDSGYSKSVCFRRNLNGHDTWGAGGRIIVEIGPSAEVVDVLYSLRDLEPFTNYPLISLDEMLQRVRDGRGILDGEIMAVDRCSVIGWDLVYYISPSPTQTYVQPIYRARMSSAQGAFNVLLPAIQNDYLERSQ